MIPTECKMPDLSNCQTFRLQAFSLLQGMIGDPGITQKQGSYRRNFARLVDKAIYEYQIARQAVLDEIEIGLHGTEMVEKVMLRDDRPISVGGRPLFILKFIDHFENCINALHRLLKLFERLSNDPMLSKLPREKRKALEAFSKSVPKLRHTVEHVENAISNDEIVPGQPVMVAINAAGDRAQIGPHEVEFADVERTLRLLYQIGGIMFEVDGQKNQTQGTSAVSTPAASNEGELA